MITIEKMIVHYQAMHSAALIGIADSLSDNELTRLERATIKEIGELVSEMYTGFINDLKSL